ncbi:hypothetical protein ILUMI_19358 [Ignelater luminosus]|uniref:Uncharacterized protein n=1 Tax=Ignelater luminosus TaxID=2038154 RepID=A0A8K0G000_IGNLU|nr:hypothetical protein ILUMI_19358 [Ignelater luminosus]
MKILIISQLLFITYFQVSLGYLPDRYVDREDIECITELNLERKTIQEAFGDGFILEEGNPIINDFMVCLFKKMDFMKQDGSLNFPNIKRWAARSFFIMLDLRDVSNKYEITDEAVTQCETIKGSNIGDTTVRTFNCLMGYIREAGLQKKGQD